MLTEGYRNESRKKSASVGTKQSKISKGIFVMLTLFSLPLPPLMKTNAFIKSSMQIRLQTISEIVSEVRLSHGRGHSIPHVALNVHERIFTVFQKHCSLSKRTLFVDA